MKTIINKNSKRQYHGHQQWYWINAELKYRGCWKNGVILGYQEWHNPIGQVCKCVQFHIR